MHTHTRIHTHTHKHTYISFTLHSACLDIFLSQKAILFLLNVSFFHIKSFFILLVYPRTYKFALKI